MTLPLTASSRVSFTMGDFSRLGQPAGFQYRLPRPLGRQVDPESIPLAEGRVRSHLLRPGVTLVVSDLQIHHEYEATSLLTPRFSAIVMLQGRARTRLGRNQPIALAARDAIRVAYGDTQPLAGLHPGGQRLRSVNLSVALSQADEDDRLSEQLRQALTPAHQGLGAWRVPGHLLQAIEQLFDDDPDTPLRQLRYEGLALQLLAHALDCPEPAAPLSQRDRQLLERVRGRLHDSPGEAHTLAALARLACMSPSTLRAKFQAAYGVSVFAWLRERRLELARQHLAQGWSVQEAAHFVGYRHASNFATAFRARYGCAPRELG
ncbi:transcriptional regulator [Bordetella trematum]|uniref:helix-turn-helix transcriptional regulator n=1 Tax=Bordetella trematum TaxID=123899 RepID=UPI000791F883|nr:helix-turn-helix transcriptional regulator [Bordetella trematum]AUL48215.1 AraC family transcriptional regulator [Bordetella trematum]SAI57967.1 transcriptional regulator [Bordetella trematum]